MELSEDEVLKASPSILRYYQAKYFAGQFELSSGPPLDSYFKMITYFDAFLFSIVSIEEMIPKNKKAELNSSELFYFLKACRNVTTHQSVLAAPTQKPGFERPFSRVVNEILGGTQPLAWASLKVSIDNFHEVFDMAANKWPKGKETYKKAKCYLNRLEKNIHHKDIFLIDVINDGLNEVARIIGVK